MHLYIYEEKYVIYPGCSGFNIFLMYTKNIFQILIFVGSTVEMFLQ